LNDLTATLLSSHAHIQVEEWAKSSSANEYSSGRTQIVARTSIPSLEMRVSYKNITFEAFADLRDAYEANHSNTFILDADDSLDSRPDVMGVDSSVWAFKEFKFSATAPKNYNGTITLVSSLLFNYAAYSDLVTESSTYTPQATPDSAFECLLYDCTPYQVDYSYQSNSLFSNVGHSVRHISDQGGLRKSWGLKWFLDETQFNHLQKFYRQKGGMMGTFGIPAEGSVNISLDVYMQEIEDYIESGYMVAEQEHLTNAYFAQDSFKFDRRVDNMFVCSAEIIEALE